MREKLLGMLLCVLALMPTAAFAQSATVSGSVVDGDGEPLIGVNVVITELIVGAATDLDGEYEFSVPANQVNGQTVTLVASLIGFTPIQRQITLSPGAITEDFTLRLDVLNLDEVVVTGVTAETPRKKLAFTVDNVSADKLDLAPASDPMSSLAGKIAGAQIVTSSGEPGSGIDVRLRGTTSLTGSSSPLFIVDGVILGADQVDIDALDIADIEVVKGAAASSLYGSRAQNGVVQITTRRGDNISLGQTRITIRNEFGMNSMTKTLTPNRSHNYVVDDSGNFLNSDGAVNDCGGEFCLSNGYGPGVVVDKNENGVSFYDNSYPGTLYNAFDEFFDPGNNWTNYVAISQNNSRTNFHASFTNYEEQGVVTGMEGYNRRSVRLNLDHRAFSNLDISSSVFYSQSHRDSPQSAAFNPFFALMFTNPMVSLNATDETGELRVKADPLAVEENPIYQIVNSETAVDRSRILGNFRARYSPFEWVDLEASASYDRSDRDTKEFYDRGFDSIDPSSLNDGRIQRFNGVGEAFNADVTASLRRTFGDLTSRLQLKYQAERTDSYTENITGNSLTSVGIGDLSNVTGEKNISSTEQTVRSDGLYATASFDYADKYIGDVLFRRDGSSLFGEDERWQSYYRGSVAYRVSEEAFWPLANLIPEFKLRASIGTAGGRPEFEAQYETFTLSNGRLSKGTLGNKDLKPELQTELELGIDFTVMEKLYFDFTYADVRVEDLLLEVPLAGYFGFGSQWRNAGTLESTTFEASMQASIVSGRDLGVDFGLRFDKTDQEITDFNSNPYLWGPPGFNDRIYAFYYRDGEILGIMYGHRWMDTFDDLATHLGGDVSGTNDAWDLNDDGYLVPVGAGNTYQDGVAKDLWGTTVDVGENTYNWGIPVKWANEEGDNLTTIGNVLPDFNLGADLTLRFKGISAYMLWSAQIGGDVYNATRQWSYRDGRNEDQDQAGKPDGEKKPIDYYETLYGATQINSHFVEEGAFVKLREVSLGYTFERTQLQKWFGGALNRVTFSLIGRNLLTISDYKGFDPEVGDGDDATLFRVDDFNYPQFRSMRGRVEIQF